MTSQPVMIYRGNGKQSVSCTRFPDQETVSTIITKDLPWAMSQNERLLTPTSRILGGPTGADHVKCANSLLSGNVHLPVAALSLHLHLGHSKRTVGGEHWLESRDPHIPLLNQRHQESILAPMSNAMRTLGTCQEDKKTKKHLDEYNILWVPPTNYDIVIGLQGVGVSTLCIYTTMLAINQH